MNTYEKIIPLLGDTYIQLTEEDGTVRFIPMSEDNSDYQAYLKSLEAEQSTPIPTE